MGNIDLNINQLLFTIRQDNKEIGSIEVLDGEIVTSGMIGENTYNDFVELIKGLQGFDIRIDDFYW